MKKVNLGKSDIEITPIVFGAWAIGGWMWGGSDDKEALSAIKAAVDMGITSIDTAPIYGMGHSEKIVGEAIKTYPRDQIQILTKFGMRWDTTEGEFYFESKKTMVRQSIFTNLLVRKVYSKNAKKVSKDWGQTISTSIRSIGLT